LNRAGSLIRRLAGIRPATNLGDYDSNSRLVPIEDPRHYLPFLSTLVTFVFAAAVFARYLRRRGPHLLL